MGLLAGVGRYLAAYLSQERKNERNVATCLPEVLANSLRPGDVLLVEGNSRFSSAIKHITQSTWSHAAIYVGDLGLEGEGEEKAVLIEADVEQGVRTVPLSTYSDYHTRICRPVGLLSTEIDQVVEFMVERLGYQYDLKNIFDLARYLIHPPPVPKTWRRPLLALGSGDPTKAICSSLIAQAFQHVKYPILPERIINDTGDDELTERSNKELYYIRHHSLFAPRDFDVSPYFQVVKPTIERDFDPHELSWANDDELRLHELRF